MAFRSAGRRWLLSCSCFLLAGSWLLGCSDDEALTELVVVVDTDFDVPMELDGITLSVEGPSGMVYPVSTTLGAEGAPTLPLFTFLEPAGESLGPVVITATGRLGEADLVAQQVRTSFIRGESRTVYMYLLRSCGDVTCGSEMTCDDGECQSVDVPATSLPLWTGSLEEPDGAIDGGMDGGVDGGPDSATDSGPVDSCVPATETCNGSDDDCDGMIDEGFDLTTDSANCGTCGTTCGDQPRSSAACTAGTCTLTCDPGFGDCDSDYDSGCEADLSAPSNCGSCGSACSGSAPLCDPAMGCVSGCSGGTVLCSMACVDTGTDINNCGGCGTTCPDPSRSAPSCTAGACGFSCDVGFGNCDGADRTGCEQRLNTLEHCAACGSPCAVMGGSGDCATGTCEVGTCDPGFADCDGVAANGCEAPERTAYRDVDGDGYGDPSIAATAGCAPMPGWVFDDSDCDDNRASAHPGAGEVCNLRDDDCNGAADDGLTRCAETCATPMVVEEDAVFLNMVTCPADNNGEAACDDEPGEPDHVYTLVITAPATLEFVLRGGGPPTLWIESACNAGLSPVFCRHRDSVMTTSLLPGTYYLHVEFGHSSCTREYDLSIEWL